MAVLKANGSILKANGKVLVKSGKGVFYKTDFSNFDEQTKIDYPQIGDITSYAGISTIDFLKETIDGKTWLYLKTKGPFSQVGTNGIYIDVSSSDFDLFCFEIWFELLNINNQSQGNFYLWFPKFNDGYVYDTYFNYNNPGANGFACQTNHNDVELYNGTMFSSIGSSYTKFSRNINKEKVNFAAVFDRNENKCYQYLDGNLCVLDKNVTVNLFRMWPHNNSYGIDARITNILLTTKDKRKNGGMNYDFEPL